ncbi:MAG: S8 family serine peptidase [Pyrinomonadaceae bacterium]
MLRAPRPATLVIRLACIALCSALLLPPTVVTPQRLIGAAPTAVPARSNITGTTSRPARPTAPQATPARWRTGQVLVRFRQDAPEQAISTLLAAVGLQHGERLWGQSGIERLTLVPGQNPQMVATGLSASPQVEFAEPNYVITADQVAPRDPRYGEQWALTNTGQNGGLAGADIGAPPAWRVTHGAARTVVAVIDSGIDFTHPDLRANQWTNGRETHVNSDGDHDGLVGDQHGWDWISGSDMSGDMQGHGTAIAGLIAAQGNNGIGISGVMWQARLMSLRVLDDSNTGDVAGAIQAIDYAVAHGARIINCSWGTDERSAALRDAIERAASRDVVVISSAGNAGRDIDAEPHYPAAYDLPNIISVAATDSADQLTAATNYGVTRAAVAAPGYNLLTTQVGGDYATVTGSSAAAALVSGVVGLLRTVNTNLKAEQVHTAVVRGARPVAGLSGKVTAGGVVSAQGALEALNALVAATIQGHNGNGDSGAGGGNGNDSNGGNNGNGEGSGQNGASGSASDVNHSSGVGNGRARELSVPTPTAPRTLPSINLPNLNELRTRQHREPRAPDPIPSDRFSPGDGHRIEHRSVLTTSQQPGLLASLTNNSLSILDSLLKGGYGVGVPMDFYLRGAGAFAMSDGPITSLPYALPPAYGSNPKQAPPALGTTVARAAAATSFLALQLPAYAATCTNVTVPTSMVGGQSYSVSVTMRNDGSNTWTAADLYRLGVQNPQDNSNWGTGRVHLTAAVPYGSSATFNFMVIAPTTPGTFNFQWQMVRDGVGWFGTASTNVAVSVSAPPGNLSINRPATQSSEGWGGVPAHAVDGNLSGNWNDGSVTHTQYEYQPWWQVDLGSIQSIDKIDLWNRTDCCSERLADFYVLVSDVPFNSTNLNTTLSQAGVSNFYTSGQVGTSTSITINRTGRYVRVQLSGTNYLSLAEVLVWGGGPARLKPVNRVGMAGDDLLSRNFNWSVPLVGLKGRAGLDLGLSLSYNSLVWTKEGSMMTFDPDQGDPTPGFRLGFPVIQGPYYNNQMGAWTYLLLTPAGARIELRQIGTSNIYESADSSYLRLTVLDGGLLQLRTPDGTQLSYAYYFNNYRCWEIKDRNGNYIRINYDGYQRLLSIVDTLGRTLSFSYDAYNKPLSITQSWRREALSGSQTIMLPPETHTWATFGYSNITIQTNFPGLTLAGVANGQSIPVLSQVGLDDGTRFNFDYSTYGQVYRITRSTQDDNLVWRQRQYVKYNLPLDASANYPAQTDCPRFTERRDWAANWHGDNGDGVATAAEEVVTTYSAWDPIGTSAQVTPPDGTVYKEFYGTGWQRGLVTRAEFYSADNLASPKKWTTTSWTQDSSNVSFRLNPRPFETNTYDDAGNRRRTIFVTTFYGLTDEVYEYDAGGTALLRRTHTDYNLSSTYTDRRIIGLASSSQLYDAAGTLQARTDYAYDAGGEFLQQQGTPVSWYANDYGLGFVQGRGLLTSARRYDVNNSANYTESTIGYNTTGSAIFTRDPRGHQTTISYADAFSSTTDPNVMVGYNTYAYPTAVTDADNNSATTQYNYDMGLVRRMQDPKGAAVRTLYDTAGRPARTTNLTSGFYTRWVHPTNLEFTQQYTTLRDPQDGGGEAYSVEFYDGHGAVRAQVGDHPNSTGGYRLQWYDHDLMGRVSYQSNMTEVNAGWGLVGDDTSYYGFTQSYDWKGRPLVTTNLADGTTKQVIYGGCGCAGGEVVTTQDEIGRRQRITSDVLGRVWKTEALNLDAPTYSVYSTRTNTYDVRDQITRVYQQAGTNGPGQEILQHYDGYGRLDWRQAPVQTATTTYTYYADDQMHTMTDARGATTTFSYNNRHLITNVSYSAPSPITAPTPITYAYDEAGNRTQMTDGTGSVDYVYNTQSQLTTETHHFNGPAGSFPITYEYTISGQLKSLTDPAGSKATYSYDLMGRLLGTSGSGPASAAQYISNLRYRAWGAVKDLDYGNGVHLHLDYNARQQQTGTALRNLRGCQWQWSTYSCSYYNYDSTWSYDYYADGRLQHGYDVGDPHFDRFFDYDHLGRLKEARTGNEAHGGTTADGPFRQTYNYDVWENVTGRTSRLWSQSAVTSSYAYTNNKRPDWQYDSDGRATWHDYWDNRYDDSAVNIYDAAGRQSAYEDWTAFVGGGGTGNPQQPGYEVRTGHDGDGVPVWQYSASRTEEYVGEGPETVVTESAGTTYYVRSAMLGGKSVAEYDAQGNKQSGHVYASGLEVATQAVWSGGSSVSWLCTSPQTGNTVTTSAERDTTGRKELDPLGADVTNPPPAPAEYLTDVPSLNPKWEQFWPLEAYSGRSPELQWEYDQGQAQYEAMIWSATGMAQIRSALRRVRNPEASAGERARAWAEIQGVLRFNPYVGISVNGGEVIWGRDAADFLHGLLDQPQHSVWLPIGGVDNLKQLLKQQLATGDCDAATKKLIGSIAEVSGLAASHTSVMDLFNMMTSQTGGGGLYVDIPQARMNEYLPAEATKNLPPVSGGGGLSWIFGNYQRITTVFLKGVPADSSRYSIRYNTARQPYDYVVTTIHELAHQASRDRASLYTHEQMNQGAKALGAESFDEYVKQHCMPAQYK